jgi:integrase/recombinase XerD
MTELVALPIVAPIEAVLLPPELDGSAGENRASPGIRAQILAQNDLAALKAWLARYADTPNTLASYRKEAERLLLWAVVARGKALSSLAHEDLLVYQRFLADPQPRAQWIMADGRKFPRHGPGWRPFAGPLSPTSRRLTMVILNTMFTWLVTAGYLAGNPLALSRQRARKAKPRITRFLEADLWQAVKAYIATMPTETVTERAHAVRARWLFSLLYSCGLRLSEVTGNTMGGFFCRRSPKGEERWWLEVTGKGDKTRIIPATKELMAELIRYRREQNLPPLPLAGDDAPLLFPLRGEPRALTRSAVHEIIKGVFEQAAQRLYDGTPESASRAQRLRAASAHWLRHTAGSAMATGDMDLRHVRDNLGHESLTTTSQYLHSEDDERHKETEEKHRMGW